MLQEGQLYHKDGLSYKVESFHWLSESMVNVIFERVYDKEVVLFTGSAARFMSEYSLLPDNLELIQE